MLKRALKNSKAIRDFVTSIIGQRKTNLIGAIKEMSLHDIGVYVRIGQRPDQINAFKEDLARLKQEGIITVADEYMLTGVEDRKDSFALLAVKEKQFYKRQQKQEQDKFEQQQQLIKQQGDQQQEITNTQVEGDIKKIYAKGDVQAKIESLLSQLGLKRDQFNALAKRMLQQERAKQQNNKLQNSLMTKSDLQQQQALSSRAL